MHLKLPPNKRRHLYCISSIHLCRPAYLFSLGIQSCRTSHELPTDACCSQPKPCTHFLHLRRRRSGSNYSSWCSQERIRRLGSRQVQVRWDSCGYRSYSPSRRGMRGRWTGRNDSHTLFPRANALTECAQSMFHSVRDLDLGVAAVYLSCCRVLRYVQQAWLPRGLRTNPLDLKGMVTGKPSHEEYWLREDQWPVFKEGSFASGTATNTRSTSQAKELAPLDHNV